MAIVSKSTGHMRSKVFLLVLLTLNLCPQLAFGWGQEGHRIVATIAQDRLTPESKAALNALLDSGTDLPSIASWADEFRTTHRQTGPWHYVNIPSTTTGYDAARDCSKDNCVVAKVYQFARILGDASRPKAERLEALKFLVHFVGDLHQPFHALGDARGGNDVAVSFEGATQCGRYKCELHGIWDSTLIAHTGRTEQQYVSYLEQEIQSNRIRASGLPEDWANESLVAAKAAWVTPGAEIGDRYYETQIPVVDRRLAQAGIRLADLLNEIFAGTLPQAYQSKYPGMPEFLN